MLLEDLMHNHVLGKAIAEEIDSIISAEIPEKETDPVGFEAVTTLMVHGPCGAVNRNCACMKGNEGNKKCSKFFPKDFNAETTIDSNGYPVYRRRNDGRTTKRKGVELDNSDDDWHSAIQEASTHQTGRQLRNLFVTILLFCDVSNVRSLWDKNWTLMSDDIEYSHRKKIGHRNFAITAEELQSLTLYDVELQLRKTGKSLKDFPTLPPVDPALHLRSQNTLLYGEYMYDRHLLKQQSHTLIRMLNEKQNMIHQVLTKNVMEKSGGLFFVYGHGVGENLIPYNEWVIKVGDGTIGTELRKDSSKSNLIEIPPKLRVHPGPDGKQAIINTLYSDIRQVKNDPNYFRDRVILTPLNEDVDAINIEVLKLSPGVPNHVLQLKVGSPIILLRNICPARGLCNGTRMALGYHLLKELTLGKDDSAIKVRLSRMWDSINARTKFIMNKNLILLDEEVVPAQDTYRPVPGDKAINFQRKTTIKRIPDEGNISTYKFHYLSYEEAKARVGNVVDLIDPSFPKASPSLLRLPSSTHHSKEEFEVWYGSEMRWMGVCCVLDLRMVCVDCG
ncbi:hypothetical protein AgCh_012103 [Apium graveolens]